MFNATQTYKDLLIKRLEEEMPKQSAWKPSSGRTEYDGERDLGYAEAIIEVIRIIEANDIEPVMQEPIKTK